jgi:exopolysaccharide biosynthesis WecB/TagA/CpsF family protein
MLEKKIHTGIVCFNDLDLAEAAEVVRCLSVEPQFSYVVTPNVDHLSRLCDVPANDYLLNIYLRARVTLCDSRIVEKILYFSGRSVKAVVSGSDLTRYLFDRVLMPTSKIVIVGCQNEEIVKLQHHYPQLKIQHVNPSMGFINNDDEVKSLINSVVKCEADYLFLAVGSPRQEIFAHKLKEAGLKKGVALCIGASINFIVGVESRAPRWMQFLYLEWFYRMLQDPKRLVKRYFLNALQLPKIIKQMRKKPVETK